MRFEISERLRKKLTKIKKKDKFQHELIFKKIFEIAKNSNPTHYKNLRKPLQELKRVHVYTSFVLTFKFEKDVIYFEDYDHHDNIYK